MTTTTFDTLDYFERLKNAGFTEQQAKVQVEAMQGVVRSYDETTRKELATKGDIQDVRKEIQDVRKEIQDVRLEIEKVRAETRTAEMRLLKWQWGIAVALAAIMAKGFGWIGF